MLILLNCISVLSIKYHVSDVLNNVVLDNVIRKIRGDIQKFFLFIYLLSKFLFC